MDRYTCLQVGDISPPQVFISSTFEALLNEIRDLLKSELEDSNFLPIMSELGSFKYTHGKNPVYDDTIQAVSASQFYILVIGRRYGFTHPEAKKSITELEYEMAIRSNLPILIYIHNKVWDGYNAFKGGAIAEGMHTHWVDQIEVFDFIERVSTKDTIRCSFFSHASDIIQDFKQQTANIFGGYLRFELKAAKWLWSEWRTRYVEQHSFEAWIVTPNFYWDYQDDEFREIVFDNVVKRNVIYRYLYKNTHENNQRIEEMIRDYGEVLGDEAQKRVMYLPVDEDKFIWCTEQILFNPFDSKNEHGIIVDIMDERNKYHKYNIELGRNKRLEFRRQFIQIWNSNIGKESNTIKKDNYGKENIY